jgi:hypothetical protein
VLFDLSPCVTTAIYTLFTVNPYLCKTFIHKIKCDQFCLLIERFPVNRTIAIHKSTLYQEKYCTGCRFLTQDPSHLVARMAGSFVVQVSFPWKGEVKEKTL